MTGMTTRQKVVLGIGGALLFLFSFVLFAYWTFPYDRARDFVIQEIESPAGPDGQRRASGVRVEIGSMDPSWVTGVDLTAVRISTTPEDPTDTPIEMFIDEASARISLLSLLGGTTAVSYDAKLAGGTIEGEFADGSDSTHLAATIQGVNVRQVGVFRSLVGLPVVGTLGGTVDLTVANEAAQTQGTADLTIRGLAIGDGRAKLQIEGMRDGFTVDRINAGNLQLRLNVQAGNARIERLAADGPHVELEGSGSIRLVRPVEMSRLDLMMRVKIKDEYRNQSDRTRALFSLMDFQPRLRAARAPDGALQYRLQGTFAGRITTSPAGRAPRPGRAP
jgi:type II secretion system protein N